MIVIENMSSSNLLFMNQPMNKVMNHFVALSFTSFFNKCFHLINMHECYGI